MPGRGNSGCDGPEAYLCQLAARKRVEMKSEREGQGGRGGGTPGPDRPRNEDDLTLSEMGSAFWLPG